jgi:hypothetical protein
MTGWVIPPYNADPRIMDLINSELANVMKQFDVSKQADLTYRPIRPREINTALTVSTESYDTTLGAVPATYTRICGAVADATVPAGNAFLIVGMYFMDDPTGAHSIGISGVAQITLDQTVKAEVALKPIDRLENNAVILREQELVVGENDVFTIQIKGAANAEVIAFPLGYRVGPHSQLDQG